MCVVFAFLTGAASAQVLKWDIEATIVEIEDPEMLYPNVRLGDPVRGFLSYDLSVQPEEQSPNEFFYPHDPSFEVVRMVIENPRDGSSIEFVPLPEEVPALLAVTNDFEDEELGTTDGLLAAQFVVNATLPELLPAFVSVGFHRSYSLRFIR
jgi:hypothetical protein